VGASSTGLARRGARLSYSDPHVPRLSHAGAVLNALPEREALGEGPDCVVVCTDHSTFDWKALVDSGVPVVDTRNALRAFPAPQVVRLSGHVAAAPVPA